MRLELAPPNSELLTEEMSEGGYADAEAVVAAGLLALRYARNHYETFLESFTPGQANELDSAIAAGLDDIANGRSVSGEGAMARARAVVDRKRLRMPAAARVGVIRAPGASGG